MYIRPRIFVELFCQWPPWFLGADQARYSHWLSAQDLTDPFTSTCLACTLWPPGCFHCDSISDSPGPV